MRRPRWWIAPVAALAMLVGGCGSSGTEQEVRHTAETSVEQALSAVRSGGYATRLAGDGAAFEPYLTVLTREAATTARSAATSLSGLQPPTPASAQLVDDVRGLLGAAADEVRGAPRAAQEGGP
ncbi:hypothetical protein, partial [Pseudonocardia nigra]|uniref:hypothetical protein n=1 Tax=Pseudonocardia nigra TaxID=1921578 RepID=UPI001C605D30